MSRVVRLIRRVTFSSGHRYWLPDLDAEQNRALFGRWASPYNHGHNYVLEVETTGPLDESTGMVVNIKDIDAVLQERIVAEFDQRSLNDEVPDFRDRSPSLENLLLVIRDRLVNLPGGLTLSHLTLRETETLYAEWTPDAMTLTRTYEFAAAHRLHIEGAPDSENWALFGKCTNPMGHGHNYVLEVSVAGQPDPRTGMMADIGAIDEVVKTEILDRYDHKNLNCDVPELVGLNPTSEVVALAIFDRLKETVPAILDRVRLYETARNAFEVRAKNHQSAQ